MNTIQKILVPFDGSPLSAEAASYAADIARHYDATLTLLYVDHPLTYALPEEVAHLMPAHVELSPEARDRFEHAVVAARRAVLAAGATRVETLTERGNPVAEILHHANEDEYDLIVMGTHGRTGLARVLLGSVAEEVVRSAPCPVLTLRAPDAG